MIQITDVSTPMLDFTFVLYLPFYNTDIGIPENKYYICLKIKLTDIFSPCRLQFARYGHAV